MNRSEFDSTESKLRTDNFNAFQNTVHFCKISILFDEIAILQFDCNFNAVRLFKDLPKGAPSSGAFACTVTLWIRLPSITLQYYLPGRRTFTCNVTFSFYEHSDLVVSIMADEAVLVMIKRCAL
jgi:hypothetical protein